MANITRRGKNGDHFLIRVTMGTDVSGKQIIKSMTWKPDKPYTEKQMLKEVERVAALFEERLKATPHISKKYRIQKKNTRQISRV